jgi:hypothetical protein
MTSHAYLLDRKRTDRCADLCNRPLHRRYTMQGALASDRGVLGFSNWLHGQNSGNCFQRGKRQCVSNGTGESIQASAVHFFQPTRAAHKIELGHFKIQLGTLEVKQASTQSPVLAPLRFSGGRKGKCKGKAQGKPVSGTHTQHWIPQAPGACGRYCCVRDRKPRFPDVHQDPRCAPSALPGSNGIAV